MNETDAQAVTDAMATLYDALLPAAKVQAKLSGRTIVSCMTAMLKALMIKHIKEDAPDHEDRRVREWSVKTSFWDITEGFESGVLLGESDGETVKGLLSVVPLVQTYAYHMHPDEDLMEFCEARLNQWFGGLYSNISKGGGQTYTRVYYEIGDKKLMCQVHVARA